MSLDKFPTYQDVIRELTFFKGFISDDVPKQLKLRYNPPIVERLSLAVNWIEEAVDELKPIRLEKLNFKFPHDFWDDEIDIEAWRLDYIYENIIALSLFLNEKTKNKICTIYLNRAFVLLREVAVLCGLV